MIERTHRTRRARLVGLALAVALAVSVTACNPGQPPALTVEGVDVSSERIDDIVAAYIAGDPDTYRDQLLGEGEDTYRMSAVAQIVSTVAIQVFQGELADRRGAFPTEAERTEAEELVRSSFVSGQAATDESGAPTPEAEASGAIFDALPAETADWLIDLRAKTLALSRVASEGIDQADAARAVYDADPGQFDVVCASAILVAAADLPAVQDRLDAGEDFGAVSTEVSIDPVLQEGGGSLGECATIEQYREQFTPELVDLIAPLAPGEVSPTLELPDGSVALFSVTERTVSAFEDVQEQIAASLPDASDAALSQVVGEALPDAEIRVDPRFGRWDPESLRVVPPRAEG